MEFASMASGQSWQREADFLDRDSAEPPSEVLFGEHVTWPSFNKRNQAYMFPKQDLIGLL